VLFSAAVERSRTTAEEDGLDHGSAPGVLPCVTSATERQLIPQALWIRGSCEFFILCMQFMYFPISDAVSVEFEIKKTINHKLNIKIKFRRHYWIFYNKNFETRSHLTIF
jgi:hypothetical protein